MLDFEYQLLKYIKAHQPCVWEDTLKAVRPNCNNVEFSTLNAFLMGCTSANGWVEIVSEAESPCLIRLTSKGETALLIAEEVFQKIAAQQMRSADSHSSKG